MASIKVAHTNPKSALLMRNAVISTNYEKPYKLTPCIVTFADSRLTSIDIQNFIEMGLHIVRFKMTHITHKDKIRLLEMIKNAVKWCCEKYEVSHWPIAISIDIPSCVIKTGMIKQEINEGSLYIKENSIVEITCDLFYYDKCDESRIYIDDPYMITSIKVGSEISIHFGEIVMFCIEIINEKSIKCKVYVGGVFESMAVVCVRGIKHTKPTFTKRDLEIIEFAKNFELDIITINSVRRPSAIHKIKKLLGDGPHPLIVSTICEQEGLDNIDEIIKESDGIILDRENTASEIINKHQVPALQMNIAAKCRKVGKPFYLSGNILEQTLKHGNLSTCDISDVTNAVLQGAGFVLKDYKDPSNILKAMSMLNSICRSVEPLSNANDFWRLYLEFPLPVNAAEAAVLGCALAAEQMEARVIIIPTVSGHTTKQLVRLAPSAIILNISTDHAIARRMQLYRGVISIIYDKKRMKHWHLEMEARSDFAVSYGIKHNLLVYGQAYVVLQKSSQFCAYCDELSFYKVMAKEQSDLAQLRKVYLPISSSADNLET